MFATVVKAFKDKETGYTLLPGAKLELSPERFEALTNSPYGVFVEGIIEEQEPPAEAEETPEPAEPEAEGKEEKKPSKGSGKKK